MIKEYTDRNRVIQPPSHSAAGAHIQVTYHCRLFTFSGDLGGILTLQFTVLMFDLGHGCVQSIV